MTGDIIAYAILVLLVIFIVHETLEWIRERRHARRERYLKRLVERVSCRPLSLGFKRNTEKTSHERERSDAAK